MTIAIKTLIVLMTFTVSGLANAFVVNADFETGDLSDWSSAGQVGLQSDYVYDGSYSAYIGTVDHDGNDLNDYSGAAATDDLIDHSLSQIVDISNPSFTAIQVHYNFFTWDYDVYDDPGFQIRVNDVVVHSESAGSYASEPDSLNSSGWMTYVIDLSTYTDSTIALEINAGNTVDAQYQSWAYVDVTSAPLAAVAVTSVPVPAAVWLFGSALGLLGWTRRRS